MRKIKHLLARIFPRSLSLHIKYIYQYRYRFVHKKPLIISDYSLDIRKSCNSHTYFGYYDISPFNSKTDEIVYVRVPKKLEKAKIILSTISSHEERVLTEISAWNWQQGSRLRWMPCNSREIVFNDYVDNKYIGRIINVDSLEERIVNSPLYDISSDGKYGLSVNFERLQAKRPGYGYDFYPYKENVERLSEEGIDIIDIENDRKKRIITYADIAKLKGCESNDFSKNYLNHLAFSPSGDKFLFFWLTENKGPHSANLIVYDLKKKSFVVLESEERVSHYVWEDDDNIVCTAYQGSEVCHYYRYTISNKNKEVLCPDILNRDGHPSIISTGVLITDTYPDIYGYQRIYMVDLVKNKKEEIISIYSDCRIEGERRTDLHPRLNNSKEMLSFDANVCKYRSFNVMHLGR